MCTSCGWRTEEENPSGTETASAASRGPLSLLSAASDCDFLRSRLVHCFQFLFVLLLWDETGRAVGVRNRWHPLLNDKNKSFYLMIRQVQT